MFSHGKKVMALAWAISHAGSSFASAAGPEPIIAPGQEKLLGAMLGDGEVSFPGGCRFEDASIDKSFVKVKYICKGANVGLQLQHVDADGAGAIKTEKFIIMPAAGAAAPPAELLKAVAARVRSHESGWKWSTPEGHQSGSSGAGGETSTPSGSGEGSSGRTAEVDTEYAKGLDLYRKKQYAEAYEVFYALAQKDPKHGILGMLVASLASTHPTKQRAEEIMAAADANPSDMEKQFVAGVAAHYYAHQSGTTVEEKQQFYEKAIKYLTLARATYDFEARTFIYLAVSNFRLGHQKEAEVLIEKAVSLGTDDPDAYYCRGEIFQRVNTKRSLEDLDRYIAMQVAQEKQGAIVSQEKLARVKTMQEHLLKVSRGELKPTELFDPVAPPATTTMVDGGVSPISPAPAVAAVGQKMASRSFFGRAVLAIALSIGLIFAASSVVRRKRSQKG